MSSERLANQKVQQQVANELGKYVYMLVDPSTGIPFYVGKGQGERFAAHGNAAILDDHDEGSSGEKLARIRALRAAGEEPEIWIVRHGMTSNAEYTAVEAACIDLLRSMPVIPRPVENPRFPQSCADQLANARREASRGHGIIRLKDLHDELAAPVLETETPLLIVSLGAWVDSPERRLDGTIAPGYGYKSEWLTSAERVKHFHEIGESASKWFKYTESTVKKHGIEYAVASYRGVTRALLKIVAGSWQHIHSGHDRRSGFEFELVTEGALFDQIIGTYGHRLPQKKRGEQTTFRYWPYA